MAERRRRGPIEAKAVRDLRQLPPDYQESATAAAYIAAAMLLDEGCPAREFASVSREMRLCWTQLVEMGGQVKPDSKVDELRKRREERDMRNAEGAGSS